MGTASFPHWFNEILFSPVDELRQNISRRFSGAEFTPVDADKQLIEIFGRANEKQVARLLSADLAKKFHIRVGTERKRIQDIADIALLPLSRGLPLDSNELREFYPFSAISSNNIRESVLEDLVKYFPTLLMPKQEARAMGFDTVNEINSEVYAYNRKLEEAISLLFETTMSDEWYAGGGLTRRQEQLLFKHAALKGFDYVISWGDLLLLWLEISKKGKSISEVILRSMRFNLLLARDKTKKTPPPVLKEISFPDFVCEQTIGLLFLHPQSLLPAGVAEDRVRKIIRQNAAAQHDIVFYIDYLQQANQKDEFPIQEAVNCLRTLVDDKSSDLYLFLCTCLGFVICRSKLTITKEQETALFKMIEPLDSDKCTPERFVRSPLAFARLDQLVQCGRISLPDCVRIVIKFAFTMGKPENASSCPYLSSEEHFKVIETIERSLGLRISSEILAAFFFFQTATSRIKTAVKALENLRTVILTEWLDGLATPRNRYLEWEKLGLEFFHAFHTDLTTHRLPAFYKERMSRYMELSGYFARAVQHVVYPVPVAPITSFMPVGQKNTQLCFESEEEKQLGSLLPLFDGIPSGPGWICQWIFHPARMQWVFSVSILDSIQHPRRCYSFQIPFEMPEMESRRTVFFVLVRGFVDAFGKEVPPDNDEEYIKDNQIENAVTMSDELLQTKGTPAELFDAFLACSPLLTKLWKQNESQLQEEAPRIKAFLYLFVSRFRINLNKALYAVLNPELIDTQLFRRVRANNQLAPVHFDYENSLRDSHPLSKLIPLLEDFFPIVPANKSTVEYSCELSFPNGSTSKLRVKIEYSGIDRRNDSLAQGCIRVTMTVVEGEKSEQMAIKYEPFTDKRQFIHLMLMQADLVSNMHHRFIPPYSANTSAHGSQQSHGATSAAAHDVNMPEEEQPMNPESPLNILLGQIRVLCSVDKSSSIAVDTLFQDSAFIRLLEKIQYLFGPKRQLNPQSFLGLNQLWANPQIRTVLENYIDLAGETRKINLHSLEQKRIPLPDEEHHKAVLDVHGTLNEIAANHLEQKNYLPFIGMINDILYTRVICANTQLHSEGLNLAFNSKGRHVRLQSKKPKSEDDDDDNERLTGDNNSERTLPPKYAPRLNSSLLHAAWWVPIIGPKDTIKPLVRIIGFATKEGIRVEIATPLDFSKALGTETIYTLEERQALGELLKTCDEVIFQDPNGYNGWQKKKKLPAEVETVLKSFSNTDYPHLSQLNAKAKEELISEALRFSFEVNFNIANTLLTLH